MNKDDYIKDRLDNQIDWYDKKSVWHQRWFKKLQIFQLVCATLVPVLVNYITNESNWVRLVIAILGALIAIVSGVLSLYRFQENWLEYRTICESLRHEKYLYLTGTDPYNTKNQFQILVYKIETLISKENSNWAQYMKRATHSKIGN